MDIDLRGVLTSLLPRLRRFGLTLTGSPSDADDLVQTVCERVLRRSDQLRDHARLDAWIFGIMRNTWIDETRSRRVRRHDDLEAAADVVGDDGEQVAHGSITLKAVRQVLATLPEEQRTVLVLVCVEGLRYADVAEVLGIPIGTVMSRLARARLELRARMDDVPNRDNVTTLPIRSSRASPGTTPGSPRNVP
jgi:RNA polymerase sigma-70 factor (ECF subfamily)